MSPVPTDIQQELQARQRFAENGDQVAFGILATPHLDTLYTLCLRLLKDPTAAEDVAQDALIQAIRKHYRYDPTRSFRPWLLAIASNLCRDRRRSVWWRRGGGLVGIFVSDNPGPEVEVGAVERDQRVREAMQRLSPAHREALALFYLEDMSYAEMSEITGVSVAALKQRVRRGGRALEKIVSSAYPELSFDRNKGQNAHKDKC